MRCLCFYRHRVTSLSLIRHDSLSGLLSLSVVDLQFFCLFDQIGCGDASGVAEPRLQFFRRELSQVRKSINPGIIQSLFEGGPDTVDQLQVIFSCVCL